jgi:hypothetical protein
MDPAAFVELVKQVGLGVAMSAVMIYIYREELKSTRQQQKETNDAILAAAKAREEAFVKLIADLSGALKEHTEQARVFHDTVTQAHAYQFKEHQAQEEKTKQILEHQTKTCEVLGNLVNATEGLKDSTKGLQEAVGRINGYVGERH